MVLVDAALQEASMKRMIAVCAILAIAVLSTVILLNDETVVASDSEATDPAYTFTYGDYSLIQKSVESRIIENGPSLLKVKYELKSGEVAVGSYNIVYTKVNEGDTGIIVRLRDNETVTDLGSYVEVVQPTNVFIVPPKVVVGDSKYYLSMLEGGEKYHLGGVEKLIISTIDEADPSTFNSTLSIHGLTKGQVFKGADDLKTLIIESELNLTDTYPFINQCNYLSEVYIKKLGTGNPTVAFWGMSSYAKMDEVTISFGTTSETVFGKINVKTNIPTINVKLLPGSTQAASMDLVNIASVSVCSEDWNNDTTVQMLAENVTNGNAELKFYDPLSVVLDSSVVAKGESTTATLSTDGLKNVKSILISMNYDAESFELKSSPIVSDSLSAVAKLAGSGDKNQYVLSFDVAQSIAGDLISFQLEAKATAARGTYPITYTVEINGSSDGERNTVERTYGTEANLTVGGLTGDLNLDEVVDEKDALYLLLHTFRAAEYTIPEGQNVDYNNDGKVDSDDAIWLKEHLGNLEESLSPGGA